MQITHAQVGNALYPLTEGQPLQITVGQTLKVSYVFKYKMPESGSVRIWGSLYVYNAIGQINRKGNAQTKESITLAKALEKTDYSGEIDIVVGQLDAGKYGLLVELPDYPFSEASAHIDDCIEVTAAPSIWSMIGPLLLMGLMVGMVSMITPMMKEGFE